MVYAFNLRELEKNLNDSYFNYVESDTPKTRDRLFLDIGELAYAVASINKYHTKYNTELDEIRNAYALDLFERVVIDGMRFKTSTQKVPFTIYVSKNILDILTMDKTYNKYHALHEDIENLYANLEDIEKLSSSDRFSKNHISNKIYKGLHIFYTHKEIKKYLNVALDVIFRNSHQPVPHMIPDDIRDFCTVLLSLSKRIVNENNINHFDNGSLKKALKSSIRSSVFIASVTNAEAFPKELLLSMDLEGLYRLCTVSGGRKIKVPTLRQLDTIVGAINSVSEYILEGKPYKETLKKSKKDLDLVFSSKTNMHHFISRALATLDIQDGDFKSEPLIKVLSTSKKAIQGYVTEISKGCDSKSIYRKRELLKAVREYKSFFEELEDELKELPF